MQPAVFRHTLNCDDIGAIGLHCKHRARLYGETVGQNRAGAADAGLATDMCACQGGNITDEMCEQKARLDVLFIELAINSNFHVHT